MSKALMAGLGLVGVIGCAAPSNGGMTPDGGLAVVESVDVPDIQNREPMIVQLASGNLLVAGFPRLPHLPPRAPSLWRSTDAGKSWQRVDVGTPADGAVGNSDVDLAVGPDGTVYFATMGFNRTDAVGTHISVGVSRDGGITWRWQQLTGERLVDRPWIETAPDGTAHLIWNGADGVHHVVSTDRGATWEQRPLVNPQGGSSHLAVGPSGELAVRITPIAASGNQFDEGVDLIAVSGDGGRSWTRHPAPGDRLWEGVLPGETGLPRWVEPIVWDPDGRLLYLWSEGTEMWLGRSGDGGQTWSRWPVERDRDPAYYPYLAAGPSGELVATWFRGSGDIRVHVAVVRPSAGVDDAPEVIRAEPIQPRSWLEVDGDLVGDTAGEYIAAIFLADGDVGVVTPLQDPPSDRFGFTWWRLERR